MKPLTLTAPVDFTASAGERKLPRVAIVAYSGGEMQVPLWGRVVVDLAGATLPATIPLVCDHSLQRADLLGQGVPRIVNNEIRIEGTLSATNSAVAEVVGAAAQGFAWQASVGMRVEQHKFYRHKETFSANGRSFTAPVGGLTHIQASRLFECSLVVVGADETSTVDIAAKNQEASTMPDDNVSNATTQTDPIQTERERIRDLLAMVDHQPSMRPEVAAELRASVIAGTVDEPTLARRLLDELRASRPSANAPSIRGNRLDTAVDSTETLTAALCTHAGLALTEKDFDPPTLQAAHNLRGDTTLAILGNAIHAQGLPVPRSRTELLRAAFSTASLSVALSSTATKFAHKAFLETPSSWRSFAKVVSVPDFKLAKSLRALSQGNLTEVGPDGELKHGSLSEDTFSDISVSTWGKMLGITRKDLINDDLGVFTDVAGRLGREAARCISDEVFRLLLANTGSFFADGNSNILEGAETVLGFDSLSAALNNMSARTDSAGNNLDIEPRVLLVPSALELTARQLLASDAVQRYVSETIDNAPSGNPLRRETLSLIIEPRLDNTVKYGNASSTAWYLWPAPSEAGLLVAFLNGKEQPTVEQSDSDFNTLGVQFRVYHDFGCSFGDPLATLKITGSA